MKAASERPPPQDVGTGGAPRTIATPGPSDADVKKAEEAYEKIAVAALKSTGRVLEAIEFERTTRNKAMDEELAVAEKKYMELIKLPGKAEEAAQLRLEAEQKYQNLGLISEQKYADDRAAVLTKWTADAIAAIKPLGEEFGALGQKFEAAAFVKKTDDVIKGLEGMKGAIAGGDESFKRLGISVADVQRIIDEYKTTQQKAITEGIDPFIEAEKAKKSAIEAAKKATEESKKATEEAAEAAKKKAKEEKDALAALKEYTENVSKLNDLYLKTANTAGESAIKRAEAEGKVQTAISLTRDHLIEMAELEDELTRQKADQLAELTGDYEAADKIREMSNQATMDKIVVAEREAAQKRLDIETKLNEDRTKRLQAWADEMNRVNDEYIARVEGSFIVSTKKITEQAKTIRGGTLPPKPGGGLWTINELLAQGQTYGLNALSVVLAQNKGLAAAQAVAESGGTVNNIVNVNGSADVNSVANAVVRATEDAARRRTFASSSA
jgi:hypothetical protein